jgi:3,4-dihydroxy 2-butanone 4-phosphate synthase/GTP cyclohydrolase II
MLGHQADEREYSAAAAMLSDLGIQSIRLMTNNPAKIDHLEGLGIQVEERLPMTSTVTRDNAAYLTTKIQRMRHLLTLPLYTNGHAHHDSISAVGQQLAELEYAVAIHANKQPLPFVTLSYAQSLDGTIGSAGGGPIRISGPESLYVTHQLRARHDAILVGIGTLLADNPQLTVRLVEAPSPQPIIVDSHLRVPVDARIWSHPKAPWIATLDTQTPAAHALRERGALLIQLPPMPDGRVDLAALFAHLGSNGMRSVMVEGGAAIITNLLSRQLAHYAVVTIAPRFLSGVRVTSPTSHTTGTIQDAKYVQAGSDLMVWGALAHGNGAPQPLLPTTSGANNHRPPPLSAPVSPAL